MLAHEGRQGALGNPLQHIVGPHCRVFFVLIGSQMVLLHGFVKKSQKTPDKELSLAIARMKEVQRYEQEPAYR